MQIDYDVLVAYGGVARKFEKNTFLYHEDSMPFYYYQIISGSVRIFSTNSDGKELTQGFFKEEESFGEPPLLLGKPYACSAQTCTDSVIIKLRKEHFLNIIQDYPQLNNQIMYYFAKRIYHHTKSAQVWVQHTPEEKILQFLKTNKCGNGSIKPQQINYTRQQIADFTGLRVETVIRTMMKMKTKGKIKIIDHKIYF